MAKKTKRNWDEIQGRRYTETAQGRDVYSEQQLGRGKLQQKQSITSRRVLAIFVAVFSFFLVYGMWSGLSSTFGALKGFGGDIDRYDAKEMTQGPCIYEEHLMMLSTGDVRDLNGNLYKLGKDGWYEPTGETMAEKFGEEALVPIEDMYDDDSEDESEGDGETDHELEAAEGANPDADESSEEPSEDTESEVEKAPEFVWNNTSEYDVGEYFTASVSRGELVLTAIKCDGLWRDDAGHLYKIDTDHGVQVHENINQYFEENPDLTPKAKPGWIPKSPLQVFIPLLIALGVYAIMMQVMTKNLQAQNMLAETEDINQYTDDQHIALPEEIQRKYDWFPDVGAHSSVLVSSMISHMALTNKGVKKIQVAKRYKKDVVDEDGVVVYYKGEIMRDGDGNVMYETLPMFDEKFADALFEASGAPEEVRMSYDPNVIPYNPGNKNREKLQGPYDGPPIKKKQRLRKGEKPVSPGKFEMVTDLINKDWTFPDYEPQRPAGAYIVDTAPVNTMVLAITRAGKGQTVIEPTIDMWTREHRGNNMVINDPKGELLVKFYARGAYRGYQIVQFNLINAMKTDIYNPLGMAAQSAREGDFTKCAMYVENIAEVFFPVDGGDDPVWPNAANNAFKRAAYGLIDYYLEEERKYRNDCNAQIAAGKYIDPQEIETYIDNMWGRVTLYNCYQMFTQLTSKKLPNPATAFGKKMKELKQREDGDYDGPGGKIVTQDEVVREAEYVNKMSPLWADAPEADCLTLYFSATEKLPKNSMRNLVTNVNNALKAMAGAEKMMASVYGIAITAMSFFTDPTISTLTSGTPSQTVDLAGYSFPRRIGVRFHQDYITKNHYVGLQCRWDAFEDREFTKPLGKLFEHSDIVSREGWARYFFDGKFEKDIAFVRLRLYNAQSGVLVHEYYFQFHKDYQKSLDGRTYTKDPLLGTKLAKNGSLRELLPEKQEDGSVKYVPGVTTFSRQKLEPVQDKSKEVKYKRVTERTPAITQSYVRYAEKPKMTFLVTPPHLMKYAKLILILIKQLVDLNFDQSYMTKETQKPLYKTRFMLDELGNLQSEGHGISGFETMLSIGLGQEQQFTLILQTLQQKAA